MSSHALYAATAWHGLLPSQTLDKILWGSGRGRFTRGSAHEPTRESSVSLKRYVSIVFSPASRHWSDSEHGPWPSMPIRIRRSTTSHGSCELWEQARFVSYAWERYVHVHVHVYVACKYSLTIKLQSRLRQYLVNQHREERRLGHPASCVSSFGTAGYGVAPRHLTLSYFLSRVKTLSKALRHEIEGAERVRSGLVYSVPFVMSNHLKRRNHFRGRTQPSKLRAVCLTCKILRVYTTGSKTSTAVR